jgi:Cu-processing system permease protein
MGLAFSLMIAFFIGCGIPILLYNASATGIIMLLNGLLLTAAFVSIALLASVRIRDKSRGIGMAILLWFYFALIYDGLVLFLLFQFSEYPMESPMIVLSSLNPIDLTRIMVLLKMDISALMGYTGAIFKDFLGNSTGTFYSISVLLLWIFIPAWLAVRKFNRKDI